MKIFPDEMAMSTVISDQPQINIFLAFLLSGSLFLAGCIGPTVLTTTPPPTVSEAPKWVPPESEVPPTQRPYQIDGKTYYPIPTSHGYVEEGIASWYGPNFHGNKTSNGEIYDMHGMTAAHKTLPMNTHLLVKNLENGREITVRVNDRGPFVSGRIIDLTLTGARELGMDDKGTAKVLITALGEAVSYTSGNRTIERFLPHENFQTGEFYVQIGSFGVRSNADRLKDKMLGWGRKTVVQTYNDGENTYYRVQVRAGRDLTTAKRLERALDASEFPGAFVVAR